MSNLMYNPYHSNNDNNELISSDEVINENQNLNIQPYDNFSFQYECIDTINNDNNNIIKIKDNLLNIIEKKKDIIEINNDEYHNEDIDRIINNIKELFSDNKFYKLQGELNELEKELNDEMNKSKDNINKIDIFIKFINDINYSNIENNDLEEMKKKSEDICRKIDNNKELTEIREKYISKRKELNSYIYFIQKINNYNTSNTCPICITRPVDRYLQPCGHTFCEKCLIRSNNMNHNMNNNMNHNMNNCMICRKKYNSINQLFFV